MANCVVCLRTDFDQKSSHMQCLIGVLGAELAMLDSRHGRLLKAAASIVLFRGVKPLNTQHVAFGCQHVRYAHTICAVVSCFAGQNPEKAAPVRGHIQPRRR